MTKTKGVRPLVPNSHVETLCMAMFRAGVTETSYPAHPGMTGPELAELSQLTNEQATKSASGMVNSGRAVITTPEKLSHRRYVLSAEQTAQCAARLRHQPKLTLCEQIIEFLAGARQLTSSEIISLAASFGWGSGSVYNRLTSMWREGELQRSGPSGSYVYSLPTQPAETAEPSNSDHTEPSIVQATIDAFHQAGEPLSDEQIEALHHMHPDRHRVLCERVRAKAKAKARQEREAREARETALFEEYLQAAVEAEQMDLLDT